MGIKSKEIYKIIIHYNSVIILLILVAISSLLTDYFFTALNIYNLLRQSMPLLLVSIGMLMVILTGGIDLSVGSIAGVCSMVFANLLIGWNLHSIGGLFLALFLSLVFGAFLGSITGLLVSYGKMASFIASLAMMTMARGFAYLVTNGQPVRLPPDNPSTTVLNIFGSEAMFGGKFLPWPVFLGIIILIVFILLQKYSPFGRILIATGSNEEAVRLAGINVNKYKLLSFTWSGVLSALGGIVVVSRASIGTPVTGTGFELDAIAACVIGGASLSGGKGSFFNTMIGVIVLGMISNTMNLLSVASYPQQVIKGAIIIAAVFLQQGTAKIEDKKS